MNALGYVAVGLVGALAGWMLALVALRWQVKHSKRKAPSEEHNARIVLAESSNGYALLDREGNVLIFNTRAIELGVVRANRIDDRVREVTGRALVAGEPVDVDLTDRSSRGVPAVVHAEVRALRGGQVLVWAKDDSAAAKVEAVRRDFIANVSHELKTPVAAISLLAEAVLDAVDDPEVVERFAGKMLRESTRLGAMVTELISLSRLQGSDPVLDLAVVSVDGIIAEAIGRSQSPAEAAGITVLSGGETGLEIRGDRPLLVSALTNLISNAIHYSPEATPVTITSRRRGEVVEIAVTDRGTGIAPAHQERVFERFFRADPARSRDTGGTGLGLAIVKHVAVNHGGEVALFSRLGVGSTFTLRLPILGSADLDSPVADGESVADPALDRPASPTVHLASAQPLPARAAESQETSTGGTNTVSAV